MIKFEFDINEVISGRAEARTSERIKVDIISIRKKSISGMFTDKDKKTRVCSWDIDGTRCMEKGKQLGCEYDLYLYFDNDPRLFDMVKAIAPEIVKQGSELTQKIIRAGGNPEECKVGGMSILDAQAKNAVLWAKALIKAIDAENR